MAQDKQVIFLFGNDEYAMTRRLNEFVSMFADASAREMNTARLDARTMSDDDLNNAANALPFLSDHRLVLLGNPSARYADAASRQKFFDFIARMPATTRLVMREDVPLRSLRNKAEQDKEDEKHWLVKWIKKAGHGLERHALPAAWEMPGWIVKNAKAQGGQINQDAAARLAELVGTDTRQAAQEVTKLLTYVNWSRPVSEADVKALTTLTAEPDVFVMVDALAIGKGGEAQRMLQRLLEAQDPFSTWGMIIRQFRLLLLAREVIENGGRQDQAAQALGVHPFVAGKAFEQAQRFTLPALEAIYHKLLEIDEAAKTGRMPLELGMQMLVAELAG
jgi:DNA polymerase-3 subunit delta